MLTAIPDVAKIHLAAELLARFGPLSYVELGTLGCLFGAWVEAGYHLETAHDLTLRQAAAWHSGADDVPERLMLHPVPLSTLVELMTRGTGGAPDDARPPAADTAGIFDLGCQFGQRRQYGMDEAQAFTGAGDWLMRWYGGANPWPRRPAPAPVLVLAFVAAAAALAGCDLSIGTPTAPTSATQQQTTTVTVTPPPTPVPTAPAPGDPSTPPGPGGTPQPIPTSAQAIAQTYAAQYAGLLASSCQATSGPAAWQYLDGLVIALRNVDQRWGYVCRYGSCADISPDVIAYLGSGQTPARGARGTWGVDVIGDHCGASPSATWQVLPYDAQGVWTPAR